MPSSQYRERARCTAPPPISALRLPPCLNRSNALSETSVLDYWTEKVAALCSRLRDAALLMKVECSASGSKSSVHGCTTRAHSPWDAVAAVAAGRCARPHLGMHARWHDLLRVLLPHVSRRPESATHRLPVPRVRLPSRARCSRGCCCSRAASRTRASSRWRCGDPPEGTRAHSAYQTHLAGAVSSG
jgi:hypothetical protein